jgi:hypothetical protein
LHSPCSASCTVSRIHLWAAPTALARALVALVRTHPSTRNSKQAVVNRHSRLNLPASADLACNNSRPAFRAMDSNRTSSSRRCNLKLQAILPRTRRSHSSNLNRRAFNPSQQALVRLSSHRCSSSNSLFNNHRHSLLLPSRLAPPWLNRSLPPLHPRRPRKITRARPRYPMSDCPSSPPLTRPSSSSCSSPPLVQNKLSLVIRQEIS